MSTADRLHALVPAAGSGARMGAPLPKQYLTLGTRTLLEWSVAALLADGRIERVLVIVAPGDSRADALRLGARVRIAPVGGDSRAASVRAGLAALRADGAADTDWVLVHDAARPCLAADELRSLIDAVLGKGAGGCGALLALPVSDTVKRDDGAGRVAQTVERQGLWRAATPQMFRVGELARALAAPAAWQATDEAAAIEGLGLRPRLVAGRTTNLKVTTPDDLLLAGAILRAQGRIA